MTSLFEKKKMINGRCGVIPWTVNEKGTKFFLLGEDSQFFEYGDFGGGIKYSDQSFLYGGMREFFQETLYIFKNESFDPLIFIDSFGNYKMGIMFIKVNEKWLEKAEKDFEEALKKTKNPEMSKISWFSENEFKDLIFIGYSKDRKIWKKVRSFLVRMKIDLNILT